MTASFRRPAAAAAGLLVTLTAGFVLVPDVAQAAGNLVGSNGIANNAVLSRHIKDGTIRGADIAPSSVGSGIVKDDTLTGTDVNESTLGQVPSAATATTATTAGDAATVGGRAPSSFASSTVYKRESAVVAGTLLGDGTFVAHQACDAGDLILSGGPANVLGTSELVESFPTPGSTSSWSARINKNGQSDNWSVVVLCLNQTP